MECKLIQFLPSKPLSFNTNTCQLRPPHALFLKSRRPLYRVLNSTDSTGSTDENAQPVPPTITPPETVEIRFKRRSKRRNKQTKAAAETAEVKAPKKWEDMTLTEKALELYVGEKGLLFWLNKFAYASIFIMIGGWILFRFAGPALNLYQLDTPPLSPTSVFKGS